MRTPWTDERVADLKRLYDAGLSFSQIAGELGGITRNGAIGKFHRKFGHEPRAKKLNPKAQSRARKSMQPLSNGSLVQKLNRPKAPKPEPFVCQDAAEVIPLHLSLIDLTDDTCHWPYGEDNFTFCGHIPKPGFPYCWSHCKIAYIAPPKRTKAPYIENRGHGGIFGRVA